MRVGARADEGRTTVLGFSPSDRELFESEGAALFEEVVKQGGLPVDDPRIAEGGSDHHAFLLLVRVGLLLHDPDRGEYTPVDPNTVQSHVVAPMSTEGAELLNESSRWANAFSSLAQSWRRSTQSGRGMVTELQGEAIDSFLISLVADAETELLTAQPQTGRDAPSLAAAAVRDIAALPHQMHPICQPVSAHAGFGLADQSPVIATSFAGGTGAYSLRINEQ